MASQFCHLHVHSEYSLLDGIIRISELAEACVKREMKAVALTDHGVMYGAIEFLEACKSKGVKPIIGCEVYVAPGDRRDKNPNGRGNNAHLVLLVLNDKGYRNLTTLVSLAYREGLYYKPRVDKELLSKHSEGLVAMSACLRGELAQNLLADDFNRARTAAGQYSDIFGKDRFFIELQDHDIEDQRRINPQLVDLAKEVGVSTVATNDCHFLRPDDRYIQDVMICIQTGKKLSEENRFHAYTEHHHFKSADDMAYRFRWVPEAVENTLKIAEMVEYDPPLDQFHFPEFIPPDGSSPEDYLKKNAIEGLKRRLPNPPEGHVNRLNFELDVICSMGFASYLLIVADFVKWAKDQNIPVGPGRGSAAGCLVSYSTGITDIDPIFYGLQFERFLNPARKSMPDIDIDFDPVGRADVINYVTHQYGEEHVCQIITFNRLKARAAIRDTGRVMDIPLSETDKVAKMIPWQADLDDAIKKSPEFQEYYESNENTKNWIDTARKIENLTRNASIHAAGVVICKDPIWFHAPVQVMEGESGSVCMYSMNDAERVGLVKMDFLGLRTLAYLREACNLIKQNKGKEISLLDIPLDDSPTFDLLGKGDVLGVFQMEGGGMRDLLMAIAPDRIEDLIACIALFRPGPMENDLHNSYARRKNKKEQVSYRHELLKPILEPTYGILTYQEQISLILQALGGIDLGTASIVIKLISKKKDRESIARYKEGFLKGAREHGIERTISREIWNEMEAFAGYGFNKAHSAAYGFIAYQTAYLKANFPLEFYAAYLSSEMHNQEKIALIVDEMKRKKIKLLPPDVNNSQPVFTVEGEGIRYGLGAIKGVGIQAVESIVDGIKENGPYKDLFQLASGIDLKLVNKGVLEALVTAGACDKLTGTRHAMLEVIPDAIEHGRRSQEDAIKGQVALFMPSMKNAGPALPDLEEFKLDELLNMEKQSLGFYLSHHPLEDVWEKMEPAAREKISDLNEMRDGRMVRVGGMLNYYSPRLSKRMERFGLFTLEDMSGKVGGIIFPKAFKNFGSLFEEGAFVLIKGKLKVEENENVEADRQPIREVRLIAEEVWRLNREATDKNDLWITSQESGKIEALAEEDIILEDGVETHFPEATAVSEASVNIIIDFNNSNRESVESLSSMLALKKGPTPVKLHFKFDDKLAVIETGEKRRVVYSPELRESLLKVPGITDVNLSTYTGKSGTLSV